MKFKFWNFNHLFLKSIFCYFRVATVEEFELETIQSLEESVTAVKATPRFDVAEPVETSAVASLKKMERKDDKIPLEKAEKIVSPQEPLMISEVQPEERTKEVSDKREVQRKAKKVKEDKLPERVTVTHVITQKLQEATESVEVENVLKMIRAKEFGPGEEPLRELAQIGFLVKHGVSVTELNELYLLDKFPALKTPQAQSALMQVVEKKGYSSLITEIVTEESTIDEATASTIGFKAFMRMLELNYATVEETLTNFAPQDFKPHSWVTKEATEVRFFSNEFL